MISELFWDLLGFVNIFVERFATQRNSILSFQRTLTPKLRTLDPVPLSLTQSHKQPIKHLTGWQNLIESSGQKCADSGPDSVTLKIRKSIASLSDFSFKIDQEREKKNLSTAIENRDDAQWRVPGQSHCCVSLCVRCGRS